MTKSVGWSNDDDIVRLAAENPAELNDRVRQFLKNLFPKHCAENINDTLNNEEILKNLNEFHTLIERISSREECFEFFDYTLDLIAGHSIIRQIFLQSSFGNVRYKLIQLFYLLCTIRIDHCKQIENIVDFILSSYHATLSLEDQTLIQLLSLLESNGLNMQRYHPFIWGESGAQFYAAKHTQKLPFLRSPNIDEIFQNFNNSRYLTNSIACFPIDVAIDDDLVVILDGIEQWDRYDPRFILPMFYHFLSVQSIVKYHKFISYGCLSYTITALSSYCQQIRNIAYRILALFYHHLNCARYPEDRQLWIGLIDFIRSGMSDENQRIECSHSVMFARIIEILLNPTCLLFPTIRNFLIHSQSKPMNYRSIPIGLYSACISNMNGTNPISYMLHQKFILNWMIDSLRTDQDVQMWHKRKAITDMLTYYNSSSLCPMENKPLIMKLLQTLAKLNEGVRILCQECSIFTWINHQLIVQPPYDSLINNSSSSSSLNKDSLFRLLTTIWNTVYLEDRQRRQQNQTNDDKQTNILYESFYFELIMLLGKIIYKVNDSKRIETYVNICYKILKHLPNDNCQQQRQLIKTIISCNLPIHLETILLSTTKH
ncbi:nucleolar pre-ribosomal-associated protein 1 [Dermatophagoides pteronyssinus]|uniref:nucleolar pre-ribosomal-associated protein 1 n=1 Tax=Dermatophagoides pteronyssinus TaxID=6956 RepID=UPI003F671C3D